MSVIKMADLNLRGARVLIREDLNVPLYQGEVSSDARLVAALPTIRQALDQGARVLVCSHLGRPTEGVSSPEYSLQPVADYLSAALERPVPLICNYLDSPVEVDEGELVLLENVRFNPGEKKDDESLAKRYAQLCDIFVMDAFGTAHRAEASTHGVVKFAKVACAGPLLAAELDALEKAMACPARPMVAIVAGSKVSTKLDVLNALARTCDQLIVGGGIANTFLAAAGLPVGRSLCDHDLIATARDIATRVAVPLPIDVVVARAPEGSIEDFMAFVKQAKPVIKLVKDIAPQDMILDVGLQTSAVFADLLGHACTILWNGPVGVFEADAFGAGTEALAKAIGDSHAFSIAGGGDTLAAIDKFGVARNISYISTGGGAFLEFVEGKTLPAVAALKAAAEGSQHKGGF